MYQAFAETFESVLDGLSDVVRSTATSAKCLRRQCPRNSVRRAARDFSCIAFAKRWYIFRRQLIDASSLFKQL
jgi:hypothetical protein